MVKAVVCSEHGLPDKLSLAHDWETPELGAHDVRMDVKAAGLNFPDVLIIQGKYQMKIGVKTGIYMLCLMFLQQRNYYLTC